MRPSGTGFNSSGRNHPLSTPLQVRRDMNVLAPRRSARGRDLDLEEGSEPLSQRRLNYAYALSDQSRHGHMVSMLISRGIMEDRRTKVSSTDNIYSMSSLAKNAAAAVA